MHLYTFQIHYDFSCQSRVSLRDGRSLAEEVDPLTVVSFALPADALPPLRYVEAEKPSAAPAVGWDMAGYRLVPLSPTASQVAAEEAKMGEMGELGPKEPIVRPQPLLPRLRRPLPPIPFRSTSLHPPHMSARAPFLPAGWHPPASEQLCACRLRLLRAHCGCTPAVGWGCGALCMAAAHPFRPQIPISSAP